MCARHNVVKIQDNPVSLSDDYRATRANAKSEKESIRQATQHMQKRQRSTVPGMTTSMAGYATGNLISNRDNKPNCTQQA